MSQGFWNKYLKAKFSLSSKSYKDDERATDIGVAYRFSDANNYQQFWQNLVAAKDCILEISPQRFGYEDYFDSNKNQQKINSKWGDFIRNADKFAPLFFNISPHEAELIDLQERLFLQVIFGMGAYQTARSNHPVGLSLAIDAVCSSSLTALHMACERIRHGESTSAIVGGVNLSSPSSKYLFLGQYQFLSSDSHCRNASAAGDGYVPGKGSGAVFIKPLAQAVADHDHIYGVIKSTAINQSGKTNGYAVTHPLYVQRKLSQWRPVNNQPRRAYISPFGARVVMPMSFRRTA